MNNQYRYDNDLAQRIKYYLNFILSDGERRGVIDDLFLCLIDSEQSFSKELYMDVEDLNIYRKTQC